MPPKSIHRAEYKVLQGLLREMRIKAHPKQADLAALLGRKQSYVSAVERGSRRMDLLQLREFCLACDQDLVGFVRLFEEEIAGGPNRFAF
jgi:transcriptional regulator with XRE-family HTH domain